MMRKPVFIVAGLLVIAVLASAQIGQRGLHIIGSTNVWVAGGSGVSVFGESGSWGNIPATALLHDANGAPLLNDANGAYLLNDNT